MLKFKSYLTLYNKRIEGPTKMRIKRKFKVTLF
jgi:hypothetical protein